MKIVKTPISNRVSFIHNKKCEIAFKFFLFSLKGVIIIDHLKFIPVNTGHPPSPYFNCNLLLF